MVEFIREMRQGLIVRTPVVIVASDFWDDYYQAVMEGVVLSRAPQARIVRFPLQERFNVVAAAWALMCSLDYFPRGSVFLVVVDPGVGTERKPIAMRFGHYFYVGPDNGIPYPLARRVDNNVEIVEIEPRNAISATFHGRDLFAPVAGEIAKKLLVQDPEDILLAEFGNEVSGLKKLEIKRVGLGERGIIVYIDVFGNVITNISGSILEGTHCEVSIGGQSFEMSFHRTFEEGEEKKPFIIKGSCDTFEIVRKQGNAARAFPRIQVGSPIMIEAKS